MVNFGNKLRELRERRGLTVNQLAVYSNVSASAISRIENGLRGVPKPDTIWKLSVALKVPYDELMLAAGHITPEMRGEVTELRRAYTSASLKRREQNELFKNGLFEGNFIMIPIVAEIACGQPIFTEDRIIGEFPADKSLINGGDYVWLRAKGDSMIGANILDSSLVLIRVQPEVESGEIAAICIDNENATLKRVFYTDNKITLMPDNPTLKPTTYSADRIRVVGKAVFVGTRL